MNISSINAFNNASFCAKKQVKKHTGKYAKPQQQNPITPKKVLVGSGIGATLALALLVPSCNNKNEVKIEETTPTESIIETFETEPIETQEEVIDLNAYYTSMAISVKPEGERITIPAHKIAQGDRLTDIVTSYARLDKDTQYQDLIPYIERLKLENPYVIKRVIRYEHDSKTLALPEYTLIFNPKQDNYLKLDSILPENIVKIDPFAPSEPIETEPIETEPVETKPETSLEDTVIINGNAYCFDKGTLEKQLFGNYQGLMGGKFTKLDKKANDEVELTKHENADSKSEVAFVLTYNKNQEIIEKIDYKEGKTTTISTYSYNPETTIETVIDKTAKGKQIARVQTTYDRNEDLVHSRYFGKEDKEVVKFDFTLAMAEIGENVFSFDSFICDDEAIGADKYIGIKNGKETRFDILENGYVANYFDENGKIVARDQFDLEGNLILSE